MRFDTLAPQTARKSVHSIYPITKAPYPHAGSAGFDGKGVAGNQELWTLPGEVGSHPNSTRRTMADGTMSIVKDTSLGIEKRYHTEYCIDRRLMAERVHPIRSGIIISGSD
jgi:hypothetical protein